MTRRLRLEWLEDRRVLAYGATLTGTTAEFTGDGDSDTLTFTSDGTSLQHNRGGDAGFNSDVDFDSTQAGDQLLAVSSASVVNVATGGGDDTINIGSSAVFFPASTLLADFNVTNSGADGDTLNVDDGGNSAAQTITITSILVSGTGINVSRAGAGFGGGINVLTGSAADTVTVQSVPSAAFVEPTSVSTGAGNDTINVDPPGANDSLDGFDNAILIDGGADSDTVTVNDQADDSDNTYTITATTLDRTGASTISYSAIETLTLSAGTGNDTIAANGSPGITNLNAGDGNDTIDVANGVVLGGTVDGAGGNDTLDYADFSTAVAVNLGLTATLMTAALQADQEVPPTASTAVGSALISNYDILTKTFDLSVNVSGIAPADVQGFHIHRAPFGVNGSIIIDFAPGGVPIAPLTPVGDGFTFTTTGISIVNSMLGGPANEASFLGGITYLNIHTPTAPGGLIRGQIFSSANVNTAGGANGTATGTAGISNIENAVGGTAADSLVGGFGANLLQGGASADTILGGPGADAMQGGAGADILVWSNGDGTDVMDGGTESDTVQVNGSVTAADTFTINAGVSGRVDFDRISPGPFSLDIGTVEQLFVNGIVGDDTFTAASLTGVADLTRLDLNGLDGSDVFNVTPSPTVTVNVDGDPVRPPATPGDSVVVVTTGTTSPALNSTSGPLGFSGSYTFADRLPVNFREVETLSPIVPAACSLVVINTLDSGPGSLREAINCSNASVGVLDTISFNISGSGVQTITPAAALPTITDPVIIDGYTQPGASPNTSTTSFNGVLLIELDGNRLEAAGLTISAGNSTVRGLAIGRFDSGPASSGSGIVLTDNGGNRIEGSFIGLDPSGGASFRGNDGPGISIQNDSNNNTIGGTTPAARNVISQNDSIGLLIQTDANVVQGNFIGTQPDGITALGNDQGITISGGDVSEEANDNLIGGTVSGAGNVIAFNEVGVVVSRGVGDAILGNSIFNNEFSGIQLGFDVRRLNDAGDADSGSNNQQNFPEISIARVDQNVLTITYFVSSAPGNATYPLRVEFFRADSEEQEGQTFLGFDTFSAADFAAGTKTVSFVAAASVAPSDPLVATATDSSGNTSEFSDSATIQAPPVPADLQITKTDGVTTVNAGTVVTYTIVVSNSGPNDVGVSEVQTVTVSGTGTYFLAYDRFSVNFNSTFTAAEFESALNILLGQEVTGASASVTKSGNVYTVTFGGTLAAADARQLAPVLENGVTVSVDTIQQGSDGAVVTDTFPSSLTGVTFSATGTTGTAGFAGGSGSINQTVRIPAGGQITYIVSGTLSPTAAGTLQNTATVTAPPQIIDANLTNNSATDTDTILQADLAVTKTGAANVVVGQNITYTITVTNIGPTAAQNVVLTDMIPPDATFASFLGISQGIAAFATGLVTANFGTVMVGTPATLTFVVTSSATAANGTVISNSATATSDASDPTPGNNTGTVNTTVLNAADLVVTKSGPANVLPGENITYTLTVTNNGPIAAQNVVLTDTVPANTTFAGFLGISQGVATQVNDQITANFGAIAVGTPATLSFVVSTSASTPNGTVVSNTATAASDTSDPNTANNADTLTTSVGTPGLPDCEVITLNVPGAPGTATLEDDADNPGTGALIVTGTTGNDVIVIEPNRRNRSQLRVLRNGRVIGTFNSSDVQHIVAFGLAGNDKIVVNAAILKPATLFGDAGNDYLYGAKGADGLEGGSGVDRLFGGSNDDTLCGGDGNDFVYGQAGNDFAGGDAGNDKVFGEAGNDLLLGNDGNDSLYGGIGNDRMFGQAGNDQLFGEAGNDIGVGGDGNDKLFGGSGRDVLIGGDGSDALFGGAHDDILVAGPTIHDEDDGALQAILAEWTSANSYTTRVNNLRTGGGANGAFVLDDTTVIDDGLNDTLFGDGGLDWFLFGDGDKLKDKARSELVN